MPQGEPEADDKGLDHTPTWGRSYWDGAMVCLVADVRVRQDAQSEGTAERFARDSGRWKHHPGLGDRAGPRVGDKDTGTIVLLDLYHEMRDKPDPIDLSVMWKQLGVQRPANGSIQLDASAPLANVRAAVTQPFRTVFYFTAGLAPWMMSMQSMW